MAAIRLYRPDRDAFVAQTLATTGWPMPDLLLLNILIEMRTQTELLSRASATYNDTDLLRIDAVNDLQRVI